MVGTFSGVGLLTSEETGGGDGGSSLSWSFVGSGLASVLWRLFRPLRLAADGLLGFMLRGESVHVHAAAQDEVGRLVRVLVKSLAHLERIGIVGEVTNRRRGRVFSYLRYIEALSAELAMSR